MQEVFYTILVIWLLFRLFGGKSRVYVHHSMKNNVPDDEPKKETGKVTIEKTPGGKTPGAATEYTDYEEIKD